MLDIPPLKEKIKNDYWMMTFVFMNVIYFIFGTFMLIMVPDEIYISLFIFGFFIFSVIGVIARNRVIDHFFSKGLVVTAEILKIRRYSRYPYFQVSYVINNEPFNRKIYITRGKKAREYSEGSFIKILILPDSPKKAIILSFYENENSLM